MSVQPVFTPPFPQCSAALPIKASILTSTTVTAAETSPRSLIQGPSESPITDSPVNNVSRLTAPAVRHKVATNKVTPGPRSGPQRSSTSARPSATHTVAPQGTRPPRFVPSQSHSNSLHQSQSQPHITPVESNHSDHSSHSPVNANHLLNFTYAPRGHNAADAERSRNSQNYSISTKAKQSNRFRLGNKLFFNKELYILANAQLVVRDLGSEEANALVYSIHNLDPDRPVDWNLIELIRFHSNAKPHCPICLFPPDAAKITRCGHTYCHSCILHYLSLADDSLLAPADAVARCPICSDPVSGSDLKSVEIVSGHEYQVGDQLSMHLMRRPRGSLAAYPVYAAPSAAPAPKSPADKKAHAHSKYDRLVLADADYLIANVLSREREELQRALDGLLSPADELEIYYLQLALQKLEERRVFLLETNVVASREPPKTPSSACSPSAAHCGSSPGPLCALETESSASRGALPAVQTVRALLRSNPPSKAYRDAFADQEEMYELAAHGVDEAAHELEHERDGASDCLEPDELAENDEEHEHTSEGAPSTASLSPRSTSDVDPSARPTAKSCSSRTHRQSASTDDSASYFYFYQSTDGQAIFLHSLNVHCLVAEATGEVPTRGSSSKGAASAGGETQCDVSQSLAQCSATVGGRVVQLEALVVTPELRKRHRYLGHLPLGKELLVAELALGPRPQGSGLVSRATMDAFAREFETRRQERQERRKAEKKVEYRVRRLEEETREKLCALGERPALEREDEFPEIERSAMEGSAQSPLQSELHFPQMHVPAPPPSGSSPVAFSLSATLEQQASAAVASTSSCAYGGPSYAALVRAISTAEATEPSGPNRGAWARIAGIAKKENATQSEPETSAQQTDSLHLQLDLHEVLSQALDTMQLDTLAAEENNKSEASTAVNKKWKKSKGKLLFSTSMQRN